MHIEELDKLKLLIDEENYPYYTDGELLVYLKDLDNGKTVKEIAQDLLLAKSEIPGIKLGDIEIPSPQNYFLSLYNQQRENKSRVVKRADEDFTSR